MQLGKEQKMKENKLFTIDQGAHNCIVKSDTLPWTSEDIPEGWSMQVFAAQGMEMYTFCVKPGASWASHKGPDSWAGIILEGKLKLDVFEATGKLIKTLDCNEGDGFSFSTNVMHAWRNDSAAIARMAFVKKIQDKEQNL
jgi:quercetin dioxygenase-like cupin family protein